jgi:hypothetical protein
MSQNVDSWVGRLGSRCCERTRVSLGAFPQLPKVSQPAFRASESQSAAVRRGRRTLKRAPAPSGRFDAAASPP